MGVFHGSKPKIFFCDRSELSAVRVRVRDEKRLRPVDEDQPDAWNLLLGELREGCGRDGEEDENREETSEDGSAHQRMRCADPSR